jgi:hypothetical protein
MLTERGAARRTRVQLAPRSTVRVGHGGDRSRRVSVRAGTQTGLARARPPRRQSSSMSSLAIARSAVTKSRRASAAGVRRRHAGLVGGRKRNQKVGKAFQARPGRSPRLAGGSGGRSRENSDGNAPAPALGPWCPGLRFYRLRSLDGHGPAEFVTIAHVAKASVACFDRRYVA